MGLLGQATQTGARVVPWETLANLEPEAHPVLRGQHPAALTDAAAAASHRVKGDAQDRRTAWPPGSRKRGPSCSVFPTISPMTSRKCQSAYSLAIESRMRFAGRLKVLEAKRRGADRSAGAHRLGHVRGGAVVESAAEDADRRARFAMQHVAGLSRVKVGRWPMFTSSVLAMTSGPQGVHCLGRSR